MTVIEPRLVIWNHLEAILTKEFFLFSFFCCLPPMRKKRSWAVADEFDSFLSSDMTAIRVEEPDLFFLDFSFLYI